jgi:hypothetical protein
MRQFTIDWHKTGAMVEKCLRVMAALAVFTAALAVAQENSQQVELSVGGINGSADNRDAEAGGTAQGAGSQGKRAQPAKSAASSWGLARSNVLSAQPASGAAAGRLPGRAKNESTTEPLVSGHGASKQGAQPAGGRAGAGKKTAGGSEAAVTSGPTFLAFTGKAHGSVSQGNRQRAASTRQTIAKQMKGRPTSVHWHSRKHGGANPRAKDAEPTKGEEDCSHASKLQLCLSL